MKFIALRSDELDMEEVHECVKEMGEFEIVDTEDELISKIEASIKTADFYNAFFIYPSKNSKKAFDTIKNIRKIEEKLETHCQAIIFCENEEGLYLLEKFSLPSESYISTKIIKRKIVEILDRKNS